MKKEVLNRIISEISSEKLTSGECREIANALKKQHNVIGGALYTMDDAECYVVTAVTNCLLGKRAEEVHKKSLEKFASGFDDVLQDFLIDGEEGCFCDFAMEIVRDETKDLQKEPSVKTYEF